MSPAEVLVAMRDTHADGRLQDASGGVTSPILGMISLEPNETEQMMEIRHELPTKQRTARDGRRGSVGRATANSNRHWGRIALRLLYGLLVIGIGWLPSTVMGDDQNPEEHPLIPAIQLGESSLKALSSVTDYSAQLMKKELINRAMVEQQMLIKLREEPFSVYLKFDKQLQGREVLYVAGKNNGQMLVHEGGVKALAGTIPLPPNSPLVMAENRYPITQVGMRKMLETILQQWRQESKFEDVEVRYYPEARVQGQPCKAIETSHSEPRREFRFYLTRLYLDQATNFPIRVEQYGWPTRAGETPRLVELYMYRNLQTNIGLRDADFDRRNRKYSF